MISVIYNKLKKQKLFIITLILAAFTSIYAKTDFRSVDIKVITSLFNLMLLSLAFEKYQLLNYISTSILSRLSSLRKIGILMITLTAVLASMITNDVALITLVPITINMGKTAGFNPYKIIVFETTAANIGSSLTPFGNPQNLYLYSRYQMNLVSFVSIIWPVAALGMLFIYIFCLCLNNKKVNTDILIIKVSSSKKISLYALLFLITLLSVLRIVNYIAVTIFVVISIFIFDKDLFRSVDYYLLGTFLGFFILTDHLNQMAFIKYIAEKFLESPKQVFLTSAALSQFMSNVPAAILISTFVKVPDMILLGVTAGGQGTLIASLANLISYKFYMKEYDSRIYLNFFYKINAFVLVLLIIFVIIIT